MKTIEHIHRDFLCCGIDIDKLGYHLVIWKRFCRLRKQCGWGILNIADFNIAFLDKWWWKILIKIDWCGYKVI